MAVSGIITVMERAARKAGTKLRRDFGDKVKLELVSGQRSLFGRRVPGVNVGSDIGTAAGEGAIAAIAQTAQDKALWGRFGL